MARPKTEEPAKEEPETTAPLETPRLGVQRFDLEDQTDMFEFIQKVAFPEMPLEMVSNLTSKADLGLCMRLTNEIWQRMDWEKRYPSCKGKTQLSIYVLLLREYLRFGVSLKGEARRQLMETAIAGLPRQTVKKGLFGREKN